MSSSSEGFLYIYLLSFPRFWTFCIDWFAFLIFVGMTVKTQNTTCSEFVFLFKSPTKDYIRETSEKKASTTVWSPSLMLEEEDEEIQPTVKRFAVIYVVVEK